MMENAVRIANDLAQIQTRDPRKTILQHHHYTSPFAVHVYSPTITHIHSLFCSWRNSSSYKLGSRARSM